MFESDGESSLEEKRGGGGGDITNTFVMLCLVHTCSIIT